LESGEEADKTAEEAEEGGALGSAGAVVEDEFVAADAEGDAVVVSAGAVRLSVFCAGLSLAIAGDDESE
jgi:hypothetical protein